MMNSEPKQILYEFTQIEGRSKAPRRRSKKVFTGHVFASRALDRIRNYISKTKYDIVLGPVWIQQLEWIQWDGAIVKADAKLILENYYQPADVVGLFEFKTSGIYGRKAKVNQHKTVQEAIQDIRGNFETAKDKCPNLKRCFYVSLHEREGKRASSIHYIKEIEKGLRPRVATCIMFESSSLDRKQPLDLGQWPQFLDELKKL